MPDTARKPVLFTTAELLLVIEGLTALYSATNPDDTGEITALDDLSDRLEKTAKKWTIKNARVFRADAV